MEMHWPSQGTEGEGKGSQKGKKKKKDQETTSMGGFLNIKN